MARQLNAELNDNIPMEDFMGVFNAGVTAALSIRDRDSSARSDTIDVVQKHIATLTGEADDDIAAIATGTTEQIKRCPITNKVLEHPVKNTCGHVMSLAGAVALLYTGTPGPRATELNDIPEYLSAKCPNAGCGGMIQASTLTRDYHTEFTQRHAQSASAARRDSMDAGGIELLD